MSLAVMWGLRGVSAWRSALGAKAAGVCLGTAIFALSFGFPANVEAAPFEWGGRDWEGSAEFLDLARSELGMGRVVVTDRLDLHALTPADGVLILHPTLSLDVDSYARFLHAGGRIVLLDDYGTGEALLGHFGMERVPMPPNPAETLRGNPSFAIAEPASAHAVVGDVSRVVTNHATGIRHPELTPLLEVRTDTGGSVLLAVAGQVATNGRFLAVGDPSIVMNAMLRYAGNKAFARNVLHYAAGDEAGEHGRGRLYMVEGSFDQVGAYGEQAGWLDEHLRGLKDGLSSVENEGFSPTMAYSFAVLLGLGVIWWTGTRAGKTHKAARPKFTRPIPAEAQGGVAGHAAVIGGSRAPRLLAMLELKSALEERLCAALDVEENPGHEELLTMLATRQWLSPDVLARLRALLLRMANVETMMLSQRAGATMAPVRDREVIAASRDVDRIVNAVLESARLSAAAKGAP
jgi:hypothetical protein